MSKSSTDLLSTEEAAEILGISVRHVQRLCRDKSLKFGRKIGSAWVITRAEVEAYQRTRRRPGRPRKS